MAATETGGAEAVAEAEAAATKAAATEAVEVVESMAHESARAALAGR